MVEAGYGTGRSRLEILSGHNIIEARGVCAEAVTCSPCFFLGTSQFFGDYNKKRFISIKYKEPIIIQPGFHKMSFWNTAIFVFF